MSGPQSSTAASSAVPGLPQDPEAIELATMNHLGSDVLAPEEFPENGFLGIVFSCLGCSCLSLFILIVLAIPLFLIVVFFINVVLAIRSYFFGSDQSV